MSAGATSRFRAVAIVSLLALAVLVALLALPPVQTRIARWATDAAGVGVTFERVTFGPRGVDARGLRIETPGATISVVNAAFDLAFWKSLGKLRLEIAAARLDGVDARVDLAEHHTLPGGSRHSPQFEGLRPLLQVPGGAALRNVTANGTLAVRTASGIEVDGPWRIAARDLAPASAAFAEVHATLEARRGTQAIAAATLTGEAFADVDASAQVTGARLTAALQPPDDAHGVRVTASVLFEPALERYAFTLDGAASQLARLDATLDADGRFDADWEANVTPGVVAAFARGRSVAEISGTSTGRARLDVRARRADIVTSARIVGRGWSVFDPKLAELGEVHVALDADASIEPGTVAARSLELSVGGALRRELLSIVALQPLSWRRDSWLVEPQRWFEPVLRVHANAMPLAWLRSYSPGGQLQGGELSGTLDIVRNSERHTTLVAAEPLHATNVELAPNGGLTIPPLEITIVPRAALSDGTLQADIERLTIATVGGLRVDFKGRGETSRARWPVASFEGELAARVPALQRLMPQLGDVHTTARMQLDFAARELLVTGAQLTGDARDGRTLFAADLSGQQPLRVRLPDLATDWDGFEPQAVTLRLDRLPIDWLGQYMPELELRDGEVSGRFTAEASRGGAGLTLRSDEPLVVANLRPIYRGRAARYRWSASVRPRFALGTSQSTFALEELRMRNAVGDRVSGTVKIEAADDRPVAIDLALDAEFPSLATRLGTTIGAMRLRQRAGLEPELRRFTIHQLSLDVFDAEGTEFLSLENIREFGLTLAPFGVSVNGGSERILRASVTPLRLENLLPSIFGFELEGLLPSGTLLGTASPEGGLALSAEQPLLFSDVTVHWGDATLLDNVTARVEYEVRYSGAGVEARSVDLALASGAGEPLAHATSRAVAPLAGDRLLRDAQIEVSANLAPLSAQPIFADLAPFTSGSVAATFEFANHGETSTALRGTLRNAATATLGRLPDVELSLETTCVPASCRRIALPITVQSTENGRSFLELRGAVAKDGAGVFDVEATLAGDRVVMRDIDRLVEMLSPIETPPAEPEPLPDGVLLTSIQRSAIAKLRAQRHSVPVWTEHLRGAATLDIDSVVLPSFTIEDVGARLDVNARQAGLMDVRASILGAALEADATIDFDAAQPKPYVLDLEAHIEDLALERLFLAAAPDQAPTAEGNFQLDIALASTGLNPIDLGLSTLGEIRMSGRDGVFRGLAAGAGAGSTAPHVIGALTFSRELRAVGRLLDGLGEIRFREAEVELDRTALGRLDLTHLMVLAPQLRISGSGTLGLAPQQPVVQGPLELSAQLGARGDVAVLLEGMKLLEKDETDGYRALNRPIAIAGSPAAPDASSFWNLLDDAAENARGTFGLSLRVLNRRLNRGRFETTD